MIYFDNAATGGTKPLGVQRAVASSLKNCANPGRSGHKLSVSHANIVQNTRIALCSLFDGYETERVIFTKNCTEALNIALFGILEKGDHVVTTCLEHNSVLRPLEKMKKRGVAVSVIGLQRGELDYEALGRAIRENTKLVAVTLCSNVTGYRPDIERVKRMIPERAILLCDGAQAGGHFPVSMKGQGIDVLALAGHKGLHGIGGSGALLFSSRTQIKPLTYGGTGSMSLSLEQPDFYPDALESGTLSYPAIVSLFEGTLYTKQFLEENRKKVFSLTEYLHGALSRNRKLTLYSKPNESGIVAFAHQTLSSEEVSSMLSERFDVAVRGGFHCAPLIHRALSTDEAGLVRASLSEFNTREECDAFIHALRLMQSP